MLTSRAVISQILCGRRIGIVDLSSICSNTSVRSSSLVSITTASSAIVSGESSRETSRSSRSLISARVCSYVEIRPLDWSSVWRRRARASGFAVRKNFISAFGKTTLPMSRPSSTQPCGAELPICTLVLDHDPPDLRDRRHDRRSLCRLESAYIDRDVIAVEHDLHRIRFADEIDL